MLRAVLLPLLVMAQAAVDDAAVGVLDDWVHVDPAAEVAIDEEQVREAIVRSRESIFVAVLRPEGTTAASLATALGDQVRIDGTYVVLAGDDLGAVSNVLEPGAVGDLVLAARATAGAGDATALLLDVVRRIDRLAAVSGRSTDPAPDDGPPWLLLAVPAGFLVLVLARAWSRQAEGAARDGDGDRRRVRRDVAGVAAEVGDLEAAMEGHPVAHADLAAAAARVRAATAAAGGDHPDLARAARLVEEARYAIVRCRARADGRPPPPPPAALGVPGAHGEPAVTLDPRGEPVYGGGGGPFRAGAWFAGPDGRADLRLGADLGEWGGGG